jgi:hypothetical protein
MSTLKQLRDDVKADLDLEDATFGEDVSISDADINRWINLGIRKASRLILGLYEDYFLSSATIPLLQNTSVYDYPSDIYGNKIRKMIFSDGSGAGSTVHEVKRVRNLMEATAFDLSGVQDSLPTLRWYPVNNLVGGRKIQIFPSNSRVGTLSVWYIRNAAELVNDSDITDIDEFEEYITAFAKVKAALKDNDPRAVDFQGLLTELELDMVSTLEAMVIDEDNTIMPDVEFYNDSN